MHVEYKNPNPV